MKPSSLLQVTRRGFAALATSLMLAGCGSSAPAADPKPDTQPPAGRGTIAISLVDDHTGGQAQGALDALTAPQLLGLLEIAGIEALELEYRLVQESVAEPVKVTLPGFHVQLPNPPSDNLPYEKYVRETARFIAAVKAAKHARVEWNHATAATLENFLRNAVSAQVALAERWAAELKKRGMLDFRRSSVADTILAAATSLPPKRTIAFCIIATDGLDEPPGRPGRKKPFTEVELPPHVHLIYLTADGEIPRPLFEGLKNPATRAKDLTAAVAYIKKTVAETQPATSLARK